MTSLLRQSSNKCPARMLATRILVNRQCPVPCPAHDLTASQQTDTVPVCLCVVCPTSSTIVPHADDNAPPERKSVWLASFYLCIPVGYALGYIYGGIVGVALGWRAAFLIEALAMLPFVAICFVVPPVDIKGTHDGVSIPWPPGANLAWSNADHLVMNYRCS